VGSTIADSLESRLDRDVEVIATAGSAQNFLRLINRDAELAIVQGGAVPLEDVSVVTPLFREFVFVIVRQGSGIQSVWQLQGKRVSLGAIGSGSRDAALKVLDHFGIDESDLEGDNEMPFTSLADNDAIDAAIVTAGIEHPSLKELLSTNRYDIVPIRSAMAMEMVHPFLRNVEIPRGLFAEHPPVPAEPIPTIATTAYLVCQNDAPAQLVDAVLGTIHEESLRLKVPTLIARGEATDSTATRMHPSAQRYFNPEDNLGVVVSVMESLVATKELLFAIGAGIYLLWIRWRQLKEKEQQVIIDRQKEHLDYLLTQTLEIEKSQMRSDDHEQLLGYLDSVTKIKLQALQELTEEELRGNQSFSILLDQCANLISKIQFKIHICRRRDQPANEGS
jgi:TRAP transporter TAXI family solute receptor